MLKRRFNVCASNEKRIEFSGKSSLSLMLLLIHFTCELIKYQKRNKQATLMMLISFVNLDFVGQAIIHSEFNLR